MAGDAVLARDTAEALVEIAEHDASAHVRHAVANAVQTLGWDEDSGDLGPRVTRLLAQPAAASVDSLIERVRTGDTEALPMLVCRSLEGYDLPPLLFARYAADKRVDVRLWAAVGAAKLGDVTALRRVFDDLPNDPPEFMWGNPWSAHATLARAAPVPAPVCTTLLGWWSDDLERNQKLLIGALTGRWDAEGSEVEDVTEPVAPPPPPVTPRPVDEVAHRRLLDAVRARDIGEVQEVDPAELAGLSAEQAGAVVGALAEAVLDELAAGQGGLFWGNRTMDLLEHIERADLPVARLLGRFIQIDVSWGGKQFGAILARADTDVVARAIGAAMMGVSTSRRELLADLLEQVAWAVVVGVRPMLGAGPDAPPTPDPPPTPAPLPAPAMPTSTAPPANVSIPPAPPARVQPPKAGGGWRLPHLNLPWRNRDPKPSPPLPPPEGPEEPEEPEEAGANPGSEWEGTVVSSPVNAGSGHIVVGSGTMHTAGGTVRPAPTPASATRRYEAWPLLTARDVVVARDPFAVTVGLGRDFDSHTGVTGRIVVEAAPVEFPIEVELVVDPKSLEVQDEAVHTLTVSDAAPYPTVDIAVRALTDPTLGPHRTLRLIFRREGRIVGLAKRHLVVVDDASQIAGAEKPRQPGRHLLDLAPLLDDEPPDLVVGVYRSDEAADVFVWDVYPLQGTYRLSDDDRRTRIDSSARDFATHMRRTVTSQAFRGLPAYRNLVGYGDLVQGVMPRSVCDVLRDLVADRAEAPSVLVLTEEASVPWELAVLRPALTSSYAGTAPFLGAHLAMSRWPSSDEDPPAAPAPRLGVSRPAVLTAEYDGVRDWKRLPAAEAEAHAFERAYPPTLMVAPRRTDVEAVLEGRTPVDLLHVALHGQYDPTSQEDGLVLLEPDGEPDSGGWKAAYLTANGVRGLGENTAATPFVFLNACQVGTGDTVLGSFAGFAAAILRTKACGVIAPLWNIDDDVAAKLSARFYADAFGPARVPVAELLRRFRAEYNRESVEADPAGVTPTYVAYQFFGHPRFTIQRTTPPEG